MTIVFTIQIIIAISPATKITLVEVIEIAIEIAKTSAIEKRLQLQLQLELQLQ